MIRAVVYDIGGTLHDVTKPDGRGVLYCRYLIDRLKDYGIEISTSPEMLDAYLTVQGAAYKRYSEQTREELPMARIWNEFYLAQFHIGEEKFEPIAEELSFGYDYLRVRNLRKPHLNETIETIDKMGLLQGIISNIISTTLVPHILKEYGIRRYMKSIVMSGGVGVRKPDPAIFTICAQELGIELDEMAYVGDTISRDVMGARAAEIGLMIQIANPTLMQREKAYEDSRYVPDYLIEDLAEIPAIIKAYNDKA